MMPSLGAGLFEGQREPYRNRKQPPRQDSAAIKRLEQRLDRLTLACMAMWDLIEENTSLTPEHLRERIDDMDLRDGKLDSRLRLRQQRHCRHCGKRMPITTQRCQLCNGFNPFEAPFDGVW